MKIIKENVLANDTVNFMVEKGPEYQCDRVGREAFKPWYVLVFTNPPTKVWISLDNSYVWIRKAAKHSRT